MRAGAADLADLTAFLAEADLTTAGLDDPAVQLWLERDEAGAVVGTTGFELDASGEHALVRSVAVSPAARARGAGTRLARSALEEAARVGARRAWLFSRRSGPFWQGLGFERCSVEDLAAALPQARQVELFRSTGQLGREVGWTLALS